MKFKALFLATSCAIAFSSTASAATPIVEFRGEVTDQTCKASINSQTDSVVMLSTVSTADFNTVGATSTPTPFTINIEDCAMDTADLEIGTTFLGYNVTPNGNLGNQDTSGNAATGVSIQLTQNADGSRPVTLNGPTTVPGLTLAAGATSASYDFGAQYYAEDVPTAGTVKAAAEYTLSYN